MSAVGYFPRFTSSSVAEDTLDWLAERKNIMLVRADKEWHLTIDKEKFVGGDLITLLIEAECMIDDEPNEQQSDIRKKSKAFGAVSGDNSK